MFPRASAGLGDIMADLQALAQITEAAGTPGGVAGWLSRQLAAFQALPSDVATIDSQIRRANAVLVGASAQQPSVMALNVASADLATIQADYPITQSDVQRVMYVMAPMLPQMQAGTWTAAMLQPLLASGVDLLSTFNEVNRLLALRDDARKQLQVAGHDTSLPPDLRAELARAIASPDYGSLLTIGAIGVAGWLVLRGLRRRRAAR